MLRLTKYPGDKRNFVRFAYCREFFYVFVRGAEGRQADDLRELREGQIGEERHVAENLVAHVRLRRVKRFTAVPDVLRAVEHPER